MRRLIDTAAALAVAFTLLAAPLLARTTASKATTKEAATQSPLLESISDYRDPTDFSEEESNQRPRVPVTSIHVYGNVVTIVDDCGVDEVRVKTDGVTNTYISSELVEIHVELTGENNSFKYMPGGDTQSLIDVRRVVITGGSKFDTIDLSLWANEIGQNNVTIDTMLTFYIDSGYGQDTLAILAGSIQSAGVLTVNADLGDQNDALTSNIFGTLSGSLVLNIAGGANENSDQLIMGFSMNIAPSGNLNVFCHGGSDHDWIQCEYQGRVEGDATFYLFGNDAYAVEPLPIGLSNPTEEDKWYLYQASMIEFDTIVLEIRPSEGSNGNISARVEDGLGDDDLVLQIVNDAGANPSIDARLSGGYGYDYWYATGHDDLSGEYVSVSNVEEFSPEYRQD